MTRANILHLSDLHFTHDQSFNHSLYISALTNRVQQFLNSAKQPDIIVFSGDLVNDPDEEGVYENALEEFILPVLDAANLDSDRFLIVPGNHDVQRSRVREHLTTQHGLESQLDGRENLNNLFKKREHVAFARRKSEQFFDLVHAIQSDKITHNEELYWTSYFRQFDIAFLGINSAWFSRAGIERSDYQNLIFPEQALSKAIEELPDASVKILISHHPPDWFSQICREDLNFLINNHFDVVMSGHLHQPQPGNIYSIHENIIWLQAGALFQGRDRYSCFSQLSIDSANKRYMLQMNTFWNQRRVFDESTELTSKGIWYPTKDDQKFWRNQEPEIRHELLSSWMANAFTSYTTETLDTTLSDRPLRELFVEPRITQKVGTDEDEGGEEDKDISVSDILDSDTNWIIYGHHEYGKTSLLKYLGISLAENFNQKLMIPVYLEFSDIRNNVDSLLRLIRGQLPDMPSGEIKIKTLAQRGFFTFLVDDVNFDDRKRLEIVKEFSKRFPTNRFIFGADLSVPHVLGATPVPEVTVPFERAYIGVLPRRNMRELVKKWNTNGGIQEEELVDKVLNYIMNINVPVTAVNGTILLTIFESKSDFEPINKSVLVEQFIETLLEKHSVEEAKARSFDFKNKTHLLANIAKQFVYQENYRVDYDEMLRLTKEYIDHIGLRVDSKAQVDNFIGAKIFRFDAGKVSFKYRAFLEYFVALAMEQDGDFRSYLLDEDRYLSFVNEIEYYAGKIRSDEQLLKEIYERFEKLDRSINQEEGWEVDLHGIEELRPPEKEQEEVLYDDIERELGAPTHSQEERDEILEAEWPEDVGQGQDVYRPNVKSEGAKWMFCLILYSGVLKNSELVPDGPKRFHLRRILHAWSSVVAHSLILVPNLVRHRRVVVNGVSYEVVAPEDIGEAELARVLYLSMPRLLSEMVLKYLGTEKLSRQLEEPTLDEAEEPLIVRMLRQMLYTDLRLAGSGKMLWNLQEGLQKSPYLLEAFLWKLRYNLPRLPLSEGEAEEYRKLIPDTNVKCNLGTARTKMAKEVKEKEYRRLRRKRLVSKLRAAGKGTD